MHIFEVVYIYIYIYIYLTHSFLLVGWFTILTAECMLAQA